MPRTTHLFCVEAKVAPAIGKGQGSSGQFNISYECLHDRPSLINRLLDEVGLLPKWLTADPFSNERLEMPEITVSDGVFFKVSHGVGGPVDSKSRATPQTRRWWR